MKKALFTIFFFTVFLNHIALAKVDINTKKVPLFIKMMVQGIEPLETKTLEKLNTAFETYPPESTKSIFMTQFYKTFFRPWRIKKLNSYQTTISSNQLELVRKKLTKNISTTPKFVEFLVVEVLLTYKNTENKKESRKKLDKILGPWVYSYLKLPPSAFELLVKETSSSYLKSLVKTAKLINLQTNSNLTLKDPLFIIEAAEAASPAPKEKEQANPEELPVEKSPEAVVESLKLDTESNVSEKIDELIENINN